MSKIFRISKSRNPEGDFAGGPGIGKTPLAFVKANSADEAWTKFSQARKVKDYNRMGYEITDIDDPAYSDGYRNEYERFKNHTDVKANPGKYIIEGKVMQKFGLSSRKELLEAADIELQSIRKEIRLDEGLFEAAAITLYVVLWGAGIIKTWSETETGIAAAYNKDEHGILNTISKLISSGGRAELRQQFRRMVERETPIRNMIDKIRQKAEEDPKFKAMVVGRKSGWVTAVQSILSPEEVKYLSSTSLRTKIVNYIK